MPTLLACPGTGSAIAEAAFELAGMPYAWERLEIYERAEDRARLVAVNPLGQMPTLLLDDGSVMTESAAMVLMAADSAGGAALAPPAGDPERPPFLRWLVYMVASIYPTFTYGDDPSRYVAGDAVAALRASTDAQREAMWRQVEIACGAPWFLGERRSAIDVYLWVMTRWRPRRAWFAQETPRLAAIAATLDAEPALDGVRLAQRLGLKPAHPIKRCASTVSLRSGKRRGWNS